MIRPQLHWRTQGLVSDGPRAHTYEGHALSFEVLERASMEVSKNEGTPKWMVYKSQSY